MRSASETLDQTFLEMRWRCLSLAADLDRVQRSAGGPDLLRTDARLEQLRRALATLAGVEPDGAEPDGAEPNRAARVQMIFSDTTPGPG